MHAGGAIEEVLLNESGEWTRLVKRDGGVLTRTLEPNRWRIGDGSLRGIDLQFDDMGRLVSAATPENYTLRFGYNDIGLRESTHTQSRRPQEHCDWQGGLRR